MASCKLCLLAAVCSLLILTSFIGSTQSASCCVSYSKRRLQCKRLTGYTHQNINGPCDINAIIFHLPDRFVCADPSKELTQRMMKCVDQRKRRALA
ncbi:C-C motif chemokine 20b [Centroberyx gerrardi]|uniref:C-C motif chemokine 20b n=1 Tax=Centroberyx gerrardi TaxID=166262 RepID=UPI003AABE0E0